MQTRTRPRHHHRPAQVTVMCAWCDTILVAGGEAVSHGMCEACADNMARSIDSMPRLPQPV